MDDSLRGKGIGAKLVRAAVEWARQENVKLMPLCPYAKSVFGKTPDQEKGPDPFYGSVLALVR